MANPADIVDNLEGLLKRGILSTGMIRHLDPAKVHIISITNLHDVSLKPAILFKNYFSHVIQTVDNPSTRYDLMFAGNSISIQEAKSTADSLSPPWFMNQDFSMGSIKDTNNFEPQYGEAIVELRQIKDASKSALEDMKLSPSILGQFLKNDESNLLNDVNHLLYFLENHDILKKTIDILIENAKN